MKLKHIVSGSFITLLILFFVTVYINYQYSFRPQTSSSDSLQMLEIARRSEGFQKNFQSEVYSLKKYLATGKRMHLQHFDSALRVGEVMLQELNKFVADNSEQKIILDDIHELKNYWVSEFAIPLIAAREKILVSEDEQKSFNRFYRMKLSLHLEDDVTGTMRRKFTDLIDSEAGEDHFNLGMALHSLAPPSRYLLYTTVLFLLLVCGMAAVLTCYFYFQINCVLKKAHLITAGKYRELETKKKNEFQQLTDMMNWIETTLIGKDQQLAQIKEEQHQFIEVLTKEIKVSMGELNTAISWFNHDAPYPVPKKMIEYLQFIKERMARTDEMLDSIRAYMNVDTIASPAQRTDVNELLLTLLDHIPVRPGIELHIQSGLPTLVTDGKVLLTIFRHLIINAFKFHDKENGRVNVYYEPKDNFYEFVVQDNGPGIASAYHQRIFHLFQTLQNSRAVQNKGVGLAIVKKILDERGLSIRLVSSPGKGATFSFLWPKEDHQHYLRT